MTSAMSAIIPTPAPIPALAAVDSPSEEDVFAVGFALADTMDAVAEEAGDLDRVLEAKLPATVPNNFKDVTTQMFSDQISATYANTQVTRIVNRFDSCVVPSLARRRRWGI
jgi:hypothetical protein